MAPVGSQGKTPSRGDPEGLSLRSCVTDERLHVGRWAEMREPWVADVMENRGVSVTMTRTSRFDELGIPNPVSRRSGVTIWQMRRISNRAQPCVSVRCRSCASMSRQHSVRIDGMDSGVSCGQRSWDAPNNAIRARAGAFMCRMRADEENTIMSDSGEGRKGCGLVGSVLQRRL